MPIGLNKDGKMVGPPGFKDKSHPVDWDHNSGESPPDADVNSLDLSPIDEHEAAQPLPTEYFVVCSAEPIGNLLEAVRAFIKDGWTPQGGVSAVYFPGSQMMGNRTDACMFFYQAVVK